MTMVATTPDTLSRSAVGVIARLAGLTSLILGACSGCNGPIYLRVQDHVHRPNPRVVMFFIDGMDRQRFRELLAKGDLPNIKRYLVDRGTSVENAVSCLPTITYANTGAFLTGRRPGHHEVIANKWLDRRRLLYEDYGYSETYRRINNDITGPTIYELLSDKYTASIQSPLTRGVKRTYYDDITGSVTWWLGLLDWTDRLVPLRFEEIAQEVSADPNGAWPTFVHAYFPAVDEYCHRYGNLGWEYRYALQNADHQIGRICGGLAAVGLLERTTLVLVGDHGMTIIDPHKRFYVHKELARQFHRKVSKGWPELETAYELRRQHLETCDTIVSTGGGRKSAIYFRFAKDWSYRPERLESATPYSIVANESKSTPPVPTVLEMCRWLAAQPAVLVAAMPVAPSEVALHGADGVATVRREGSVASARYRYAVREGSDPLGYASHEQARRLMDGQYHSADEWFAATVDTEAPDIPGQICEMFDTPRAGEIMLFAAPEWGFSWLERAGHGSITAREMFVPMVWAGADIAVGARVERARTCDVMPTILDVLGVSDRLADYPPIDGVSLLPKLRKHELAKRP